MTSRPRTVGPDAGPEAPYPYRMEGQVISGFGRGSKELGIPTANLPVDNALTPWIAQIPSGVYFGYASLLLPPSHPDALPTSTPTTATTTSSETASTAAPSETTPTTIPTAEATATTTSTTSEPTSTNKPTPFQVYPMVMSIGYNPFYKNTLRSAEVHILHSFAQDFYHCPMRLLIAGFIRDERDYDSLDALVADIRFDCAVARDSLAREGWEWRTVGGEEAAGWLVGPAPTRGE